MAPQSRSAYCPFYNAATNMHAPSHHLDWRSSWVAQGLHSLSMLGGWVDVDHLPVRLPPQAPVMDLCVGEATLVGGAAAYGRPLAFLSAAARERSMAEAMPMNLPGSHSASTLFFAAARGATTSLDMGGAGLGVVGLVSGDGVMGRGRAVVAEAEGGMMPLVLKAGRSAAVDVWRCRLGTGL